MSLGSAQEWGRVPGPLKASLTAGGHVGRGPPFGFFPQVLFWRGHLTGSDPHHHCLFCGEGLLPLVLDGSLYLNSRLPGPNVLLQVGGFPPPHTHTQPSTECNLEPLPIFLSPSPTQKRSCCFSGDKRHRQEMSALMPASHPPLPVTPSLLALVSSKFQPRDPGGRPLGLRNLDLQPGVQRPALSPWGFPWLCPPPQRASAPSSQNETPLAEASARLDKQI